jgi:hypothetical protein
MWRELFEGCLQVDPTEQTADALVASPFAVPTCKGVVLFCDGDDRPVQLLIAANIRRLAKNRLFPPEPERLAKRADIRRVVRRIYYLCCFNDFRSMLRHLQIARTIYPDSWRSLISLPKPWFVKINPLDEWPNFSATNKAAVNSDVRYFGPFPTRKSADKYIAALRSAFGLCQRPDLVDSAQKAATCPYLQMKTCPAPCVGRISRSDYASQIAEAVSAASGEVRRHIEAARRQMTDLAEQRQFEQADMAKKRLESLEVLLKDDYRWTTDLSKLAILHIDRSAKVAPAEGKRKVQSYAGFLLTGGGIVELDDFTLADIEKFHASFMDSLKQPVETSAGGHMPERLGLAAYFLYRRNPPGLWINASAEETIRHESLTQAIETRFKQRRTNS